MFVLKHFSVVDESGAQLVQEKKVEKNPFNFNFEKENEGKAIDIDPPLLYKKPSDYDFKKMIKIYLEHKNMI